MKETTSTYGYLLGRTLADFWSWWTDQIVSSIPLWLRQILFNAKNLLLEVDGDIIEIYRAIGHRKNNIGRVLLSELTTHQVAKLIRESNAQDKILSLSNQLVLEKNVSFPLATEENIREVLSFEMDRLTPFALDQIYYDYYVLSRDKEKSTIDLKLIIVPKDKIDPLINKLNQIGFHPHVVTVRNSTTSKQYPINLLPTEMRAKRLNALRMVNYSLGMLVIVLFMVSVFLPISNKLKYIEQLEPEVSLYSKQADKIIKLRKQLETAKEEAQFLSEKKKEKLLMLEILDELTQIVPDDTWINQYEIKNNELHIHGQSISSASLLSLIESSDLFTEVQFRSPVTQNRQTQTERFHLSAYIEQEQKL
jgi:general secretion pathway protein L